MRGLILAVAAACFAAALAIAGAALRLPVPQPAPPVAAALPPAPAPAPEAVADPPAQVAADAPAAPAAPIQAAVDVLAREQAASREIVTELRATVAQLQRELAGQRAARPPEELPGRLVVVLGGDVLPAGQETAGPGVARAVRSVLPEIVAAPDQIVSVEGHTDGRPIRAAAGKPFKDNADLSLLRARAVAAQLQSAGVAAARIRVKGFGDTRPLATNDTAEGRDKNRRVEIRLLSPAAER